MPNTAREIFADLGVVIAGQRLVIADLERAQTAYVHHSTLPAAMVAFAVASPTFARGRFPKMRLLDLVAARSKMDIAEIQALADAGGAEMDVPYDLRDAASAFQGQLIVVIEKYGLGALYDRYPEHRIGVIDVKPRGVNYSNYATIPAEMAAWRAAYKQLPPVRQIMAATIMWLYRGGADKTWMERLPRAWHAADAIDILKLGDALRDWARLVALYPGW